MIDLINKLFPKDDSTRSSSMFVERGLEALRLAREERAFKMGDVKRAPSRYELRVSKKIHQSLENISAIRDLEFHFRDELMKDLTKLGMRTYGDHSIRVTIAVDPTLDEREMYAAVLNPSDAPERSGQEKPRGGAPARGPDATRVLAEEELEEPKATDETQYGTGAKPSAPPPQRFLLRLRQPDGSDQQQELSQGKWILGRRGSSGEPLPAGFQKIDLDLPPSISREQLRIEIEPTSIFLQRIGKAPVSIGGGDELGAGDSRRILPGTPVQVDAVEMIIDRA